MQRLREVPWEALDVAAVLPAIASVLAGAPAERELERTRRGRRDCSREQRRAAAEAVFGVALWRRRLAWQADSSDPAALLRCLVGGLAGEPERLADRWSLPDWLEQVLLEELGPQAEEFCAAIAVPGPVCLRANRLLCTRERLAEALAAEGIATRPAARAPDALVVETRQADLFR